MQEADTGAALPQASTATTPLALVDQVAPKGWRVKLAKVTLQLLVGTREGAALYGAAREQIDEIEGRTAMNKQLYALAAQQVLADPMMVERAKARLVGDTLQRQENLEAVLGGAAERMLSLPPPLPDADLAASVDQQPDDSVSDPDDGGLPLDEDWASTFTQYAEHATSKGLRQRLSRILAGELVSEGAFPRSTIRAIAELDKFEIEAMIQVLPHVICDLVVTGPLVDRDVLVILGEAGLIDASEIMTVTRTWSAKPMAPGALPGSDYALMMQAKADKAIELTGSPLTRVGRSLITLLDEYDEVAVLKAFAETMDKTDVSTLALGKYIKLPGNQIRLVQGEQLYPKPVVFNIPPIR